VGLWWVLEGEGLTLQWIETGGPPVRAPFVEGYGTRVISASVERQLDGGAAFDWRPEGLHFRMSIPLGERDSSTESAGGEPVAAEHNGAGPQQVMPGNRLLLVEDEALTGMMMSEMLTDLGFDVIGPFARVADAMAAIKREDFHAAVLDVNLDGEVVYPVADAVLARGVPFVFVTGYSADGIDRRFAQVPVLQKPIERQMLQSVFCNGGQQSGEAVRG